MHAHTGLNLDCWICFLKGVVQHQLCFADNTTAKTTVKTCAHTKQKQPRHLGSVCSGITNMCTDYMNKCCEEQCVILCVIVSIIFIIETALFVFAQNISCLLLE